MTPFDDDAAGPYCYNVTAERSGDSGVAAAADLINLGVTFTVYSGATAIDPTLPFDCIPRILTAAEWRLLEAGVVQQTQIPNASLRDVKHVGDILRDGVVPADLVRGNSNRRPETERFPVRLGTYVHIRGTDIVRDEQGRLPVLGHNAGTPSGISNVVENRHLTGRASPDLKAWIRLRPVYDDIRRLMEAMAEIAPEGADDAQVVLVSPGVYNSG